MHKDHAVQATVRKHSQQGDDDTEYAIAEFYRGYAIERIESLVLKSVFCSRNSAYHFRRCALDRRLG
jgi:hypothetical protein